MKLGTLEQQKSACNYREVAEIELAWNESVYLPNTTARLFCGRILYISVYFQVQRLVHGKRALILALESDDSEMVRYLINSGMDKHSFIWCLQHLHKLSKRKNIDYTGETVVFSLALT